MEPKIDISYDYLRYVSETVDKKAVLTQLMDEYGNDVWNYAFSLTRKPEYADDITQDVFLKAYRHLHTYRGQSSMKTWLLAITRNTVKDFHKSAFFRRVSLMDWIIPGESHRSAESEVMERQAVNEIWQKVLSLPPKYREVLILFAHHQLSMKEIAELLQTSVGTVKSRLHHARTKVAQLKDREMDE